MAKPEALKQGQSLARHQFALKEKLEERATTEEVIELTVAWNFAVGEGAVDAVELKLLVDILVTLSLLIPSVMGMRLGQ